VEVIVASGYFSLDAFVIHLARAVDVFTQPVIEIVLGTTFGYLLFVVKFDLRN